MDLSQEEVRKRVSILKRLKENLLQQRQKFQTYLVVLEKEKESIAAGQVEALQSQVTLEESIVTDIYTFQKVIDPLEDLYRASAPLAASESAEEDREVVQIKSSLENLKEQVLEKNKANRSLLSSKLQELKTEIVTLKKPRRGRSVYGYGEKAAPSLVDITT